MGAAEGTAALMRSSLTNFNTPGYQLFMARFQRKLGKSRRCKDGNLRKLTTRGREDLGKLTTRRRESWPNSVQD